MSETQAVQLFDGRRVRTVWDDKQEKLYFSVVDVVCVLTDSPTPRKYWSVLKTRLKKEGSEVTTICSQLKLEASDGKKYMADVADTEQLFRIIQSIPSPKAEPFKMWLAKVGSDRVDQMQDPELGVAQAVNDYKRLGYSDKWIRARIRSIEVRNDLTEELQGTRGQNWKTSLDAASSPPPKLSLTPNKKSLRNNPSKLFEKFL